MILYSDPQQCRQSIEYYLNEVNEHARDAARIVLIRSKVDESPL